MVDHPFSDHPDIAIGVANCLAAWSKVELALGMIFIDSISRNKAIGAGLWNGFQSERVKLDAFRSLCASNLSGEDYELSLRCLKMYNAYAKTRNKIAHWLWFVPENYRDGLALADPTTYIGFFGKFYDSQAMLPNSVPELMDKMYLYRKPDLDRDADDFLDVESAISELGFLFFDVAYKERVRIRESLRTNARLVPFLSP